MLGIVQHGSFIPVARRIDTKSDRASSAISQLPESSNSRSARRDHHPQQQPRLQQQPWPPSRLTPKEPHQSSCGSILICIWNIPPKVKRRDFNFLMARLPGVERWDFVSRGPSQESAGYAYCECPTMDDADEAMRLIRSFRVANTKLRANLFDPSRVDWSFSPGKVRVSAEKREKDQDKLEMYQELDAEELKTIPPSSKEQKQKQKRSVADPQRKKKRKSQTKKFIRERPPSRKLLLGYADDPGVAKTDSFVEDCDEEKNCQ